jgi:hypothetical protein
VVFLRALDLRREDPPLDRRDELLRLVLRALELLRARELFLPEDLRPLLRPAPPRRRELPPLLRPDDADRERFLPPLELLDFLAAAIAKLRVRRVRGQGVARFAHNTVRRVSNRPANVVYSPRARVSPCFMIHKSSTACPAVIQTSRMRAGGSSIGSSVSLNVPQ